MLITPIVVLSLALLAVAVYFMLVSRRRGDEILALEKNLDDAYQYKREECQKRDDKIAKLERLISVNSEDDELTELKCDLQGPVSCFSDPPSTSLIEKLKARHSKRIADYDREQRRLDERNTYLGKLYRELQCATELKLDRLRGMLNVKLNHKCPTCGFVDKLTEYKLEQEVAKKKYKLTKVKAPAKKDGKVNNRKKKLA